jgi:hypothetical protein
VPHTTRPRRLGLLAVALAVLTVLIATTAAPAHADKGGAPAGATVLASFYEGNSPDALWTGNNGIKYRCSDDARTVREAYLPGGGALVAELRYSPRCRTAWARGHSIHYIKVNGYYLNGSFRTYAYAGANPNAPYSSMHWTVMLDDAGLLASACAGWWGINDWEEYCTSRY